MDEGIKIAKYEDINVGDAASLSKTITQADVTLFAGITGDFNPLHVNEEYAKKTQFGRRLVHGAFSSGLISAVLGMKLPGPGALYASQSCKFVKPVFIGDTITAKAVVKEKFTKKDGKLKFLKIETNCYNQDGALVTEGEALIIVM
ncbi:enoyl-CoA hydratase [Candidatus Bathyarchaeota archaeon]|nr:enoyl-CoA hydratase [Candidatus Bathyarchaeota archaeon]